MKKIGQKSQFTPEHRGKADKKYLSDLIRKGDVNITNTSYKNIKDILREFFSYRNVKILCCNFGNFAASLDLETKYNSAKQCKAGELQYLHFILMSILSHIFPSLILSENGEEEVDHNDKDNTDDDAKGAANDANREFLRRSPDIFLLSLWTTCQRYLLVVSYGMLD